MSSKGKLLIAVLVIALLAGALSVTGLAAPKVITFWTFAQNNLDEWKSRQDEIEKAQNIKLNLVLVPQTAFIQKLQATLIDGKGFPDIIEWMIETNRILNGDPKKCFVYPLDKYVAKSAGFKDVPTGRVAWVTYGGHVYGLPHDIHPVVLIYNDTLWKSVGVDVASLETWDDFFAAAQKLAAEKKDDKPLHYALPDIGSLNGTMFMIWQQSGGQILDKKGNPTIEDPKFKAFVTKYLSWVKTGTMCSWDWGNFSAMLKNGTLASYTSPDWYTTQVNDAAKAGEYKFKARLLPYYTKGGPQTASWGGSFLAIPRLAKNPDQLYKIVEYMQYSNAIKYRYRDTGMLPPNMKLFDDETFHKPDPRFGGQKLGELQITAAKEMPSVNTGNIFWDALGDFNTQYTEMVAGKISIDEGLKKAQADALKRIK
jgi:arabinosaccharide transport system substrate-binding protein